MINDFFFLKRKSKTCMEHKVKLTCPAQFVSLGIVHAFGLYFVLVLTLFFVNNWGNFGVIFCVYKS